MNLFMIILSDVVEETSKLTQFLQGAKGWLVGLGIAGVVGLFANTTLSLKRIFGDKKLSKLINPLIKDNENANKSIVNLASGMVNKVEIIEQKVADIIAKVDLSDIRNNNTVKSLAELSTIIVALSTSPTELKSQALGIIKNLNLELQGIDLLEKSIELKNESNKDSTLQDIIDSEI